MGECHMPSIYRMLFDSSYLFILIGFNLFAKINIPPQLYKQNWTNYIEILQFMKILDIKKVLDLSKKQKSAASGFDLDLCPGITSELNVFALIFAMGYRPLSVKDVYTGFLALWNCSHGLFQA